MPIQTGNYNPKYGYITIKNDPQAGVWVLSDSAGNPIMSGDQYLQTFQTEEQVKAYLK